MAEVPGLNAPGSPPDFLYAALNTTVCAALIKESRMNFANANHLHRKSGWRRLASVTGVVRMPSKYCKCPVDLLG